MRAFTVVWRSCVSVYNELFLMIGTSLLWWLTGGFFIALAVFLGLGMVEPVVQSMNVLTPTTSSAGWLALIMPIIAIIAITALPAGPATAALANVTHRVARDLRADRSFFFEGFREYWKKALGVSAILALVTSALILNLLFYFSRPEPFLKALTLLFVVLLLFWLSVQVYAFPILVGMKEASVLGAIKMALMMAFANPLFSMLIIVIAALLTGLSVVLTILVLLIWPAMMLLLGSHALKLVVELAVGPTVEGSEGDKAE
jgi:uncharacterized membrane protein YesL